MRTERKALTWATAGLIGLLMAAAAWLVWPGLNPDAPAGGTAAPGMVGTRPADSSERPPLNPVLKSRYLEAKKAAKADGVKLVINSGARSRDEQQEQWDKAVERYGSEAEAKRYVLPAEVSAHTQGTAIDVGPPEGAVWLEEHGPEFGLCRIYENEPWHFEAPIEPGGTCPDLVADALSVR
jgi:hypothetical protein